MLLYNHILRERRLCRILVGYLPCTISSLRDCGCWATSTSGGYQRLSVDRILSLHRRRDLDTVQKNCFSSTNEEFVRLGKNTFCSLCWSLHYHMLIKYKYKFEPLTYIKSRDSFVALATFFSEDFHVSPLCQRSDKASKDFTPVATIQVHSICCQFWIIIHTT